MGLLDKFKKKDDFDSLLNEPVDGGWGSDSSLGSDPLSSDPAGMLGSNPGSPMPQDLGSQNSMMHQGMGGSDFHSDPAMSGDDFSSGGDVMGLPEQSYHESQNTSASSLNLNTNYPTAPSQTSHGQQGQQGQQSYNPQHNSQPQQEHGAPQSQNHNNEGLNKNDVELILAKLDLIKSTLQHLDSRMSNIEHKMYEEKKW